MDNKDADYSTVAWANPHEDDYHPSGAENSLHRNHLHIFGEGSDDDDGDIPASTSSAIAPVEPSGWTDESLDNVDINATNQSITSSLHNNEISITTYNPDDNSDEDIQVSQPNQQVFRVGSRGI